MYFSHVCPLLHNSWLDLFHYFLQRDGPPDLKGSLSTEIPFQAIAQVNREVQDAREPQVTQCKGAGRNRQVC